MANIDDVDDSFLAAKAEVDAFFDEFNAEWYAPQIDMMLTMLMDRITPEVQANLQAMVPQDFKAVQEMMKRRGITNA
jgi:hypothetical protein